MTETETRCQCCGEAMDTSEPDDAPYCWDCDLYPGEPRGNCDSDTNHQET